MTKHNLVHTNLCCPDQTSLNLHFINQRIIESDDGCALIYPLEKEVEENINTGECSTIGGQTEGIESGTKPLSSNRVETKGASSQSRVKWEEGDEYGRELFEGSSGGLVFDNWEEAYPFAYRKQAMEEYRELLRELDKKTRAKLTKRIYEFDRCGNIVRVRTCECCGEDRTGSGSYGGSQRTCKMTICPTCGWIRAKKVEEFYLEAGSLISPPEGVKEEYVWQFFTLTTRYDPYVEADVTWQALRKRLLLVNKTVSKLWKSVMNVKGAAMHRTTECSVRGHVHAHILYFGPSIDEKDITDTAKSLGGDGIGHIHKKDIECGDGSGKQLPLVVAKLARYMSKGTSGYGSEFDESHYGYEGEAIVTMDPRLAARWELATSIRRTGLSARYGALRGIEYEPEDHSCEPADDSQVPCKHCGTVGKWKNEYRRAEVFIQDCHAAGSHALEGGHYTPPWWRSKRFQGGTKSGEW